MSSQLGQEDSAVERLAEGILSRDRSSLSQGITLVESTNSTKHAKGQLLLATLLQKQQAQQQTPTTLPDTFRIGVSGCG